MTVLRGLMLTYDNPKDLGEFISVKGCNTIIDRDAVMCKDIRYLLDCACKDYVERIKYGSLIEVTDYYDNNRLIGLGCTIKIDDSRINEDLLNKLKKHAANKELYFNPYFELLATHKDDNLVTTVDKMALLKIGLVVKCYKNRDYYDDNLLVEVKER